MDVEAAELVGQVGQVPVCGLRADQVGSRGRQCCGERSPDVGFRASVVMEKQQEMVEKKDDKT